jgi:hypothetical protein
VAMTCLAAMIREQGRLPLSVVVVVPDHAGDLCISHLDGRCQIRYSKPHDVHHHALG